MIAARPFRLTMPSSKNQLTTPSKCARLPSGRLDSRQCLVCKVTQSALPAAVVDAVHHADRGRTDGNAMHHESTRAAATALHGHELAGKALRVRATRWPDRA